MRRILIAIIALTVIVGKTVLVAQSVKGPTVASVAGCYSLKLAAWEDAYVSGTAPWQVLPPVFRLDTVPASSDGAASAWRRTAPNPVYFTEARTGPAPQWKLIAPDSVRAFWSTGFVGTRLSLVVHGDTLVGRAQSFTDVRGAFPDPFATAIAIRAACPANLQ